MFKTIQKHRQSTDAIRRFAEQHDFVSFGNVGKTRTFNHVRGVTFSPDARDDNYMHAAINGIDITVLTRQVNLKGSPNQSHASQSEWTIMRANLLDPLHLPHILLDNKSQSPDFYEHMSVLYPRLRKATHALQHINPTADFTFDIYLAPDDVYTIYELFDSTMLQRMAFYYTAINAELHNNEIILYAPRSSETLQRLNEMLAELFWLCQHMENRTHTAEAAIADLSFVAA